MSGQGFISGRFGGYQETEYNGRTTGKYTVSWKKHFTGKDGVPKVIPQVVIVEVQTQRGKEKAASIPQGAWVEVAIEVGGSEAKDGGRIYVRLDQKMDEINVISAPATQPQQQTSHTPTPHPQQPQFPHKYDKDSNPANPIDQNGKIEGIDDDAPF